MESAVHGLALNGPPEGWARPSWLWGGRWRGIDSLSWDTAPSMYTGRIQASAPLTMLPPPTGFQNGVYKAIRDMAKAKGIHLDLFQYLMLLHPDPPAMPHFWSVPGGGRVQA